MGSAPSAMTPVMAAPGQPKAPADRGRRTISVAPTRRPGDDVVPAPTTKRASGKTSSPKVVPTLIPVPTEARTVQTVSSGVYVTGTVGLAVGSRYAIQLDGIDLRVLGPLDQKPKHVAFERALDGIDATGLDGRLIVTASSGRGGIVLVFMSIEGDLGTVVDAIGRAARAAGSAA